MSATLDQTKPARTERDIDRFPRTHALFNICAIVVVMMIFNLFPERVGVWRFAGESTSFTPVLNATFLETWLPWFNLWWILALSLNVAHLLLGHWTLVTRMLDIVVIAFGLNIVLGLLFGSPATAISPLLETADFGWAQVMRDMAPQFNWLIPFILVVIALAVGVDLIRKVVQLVRSVVR